MVITYIVIGVFFSVFTLWTLADEPKCDEIQSAIAAIIVGAFWPIVLVLVIFGNVFNILTKIRQH